MKKVVGVLCVFVIIAIVTCTGIWLFGDHSQVKEGIYRSQNSSKYPNAYIVVEDGTAQFYNIDLNEMYKAEIVENYIDYLVNYKEHVLSSSDKKEIKEAIDLNGQFCQKKIILNYEKENSNYYDETLDIYNYNFGYVTDVDYLAYDYDWKKDTITLTRDDDENIVFVRE